MNDKVPDAPLLSLLIPTKDRYETLLPVLGAISQAVCDETLEIVICDNSSGALPEDVRSLIEGDSRIVYHHVAKHLSIVDNTEVGIGLCRGTYICFIGDDDLVSPFIMDIVRWVEEKGADALIYPPARYWWSSVKFATQTRFLRPGAFWLPKARSGTVSLRYSSEELSRVRAKGGVSYADLPRVYHGIVSRRALDRISARFGRVVPGSSPDMALCMALAMTTSEYLAIDYPVTVFGAARNSGGGLTAARRHYGRIEDQDMLPSGILDNWDSRLPRVWSEQIIYPQTIHEVSSRLGQETGINYPTMYASLLAYEPHILRYLLPILIRRLARFPNEILPITVQLFRKLAGRARTAWRHRTGVGLQFDLYDFPNVAAATAFLSTLPRPFLGL